MDMTTLMMFGIGLLVLWILFKVFSWPVKVLFKLVLNAVAGAIVLLVVNIIGGFFNFTLPITAFTSLIVGLLGVPGVALIAVWVFLL